MGWTYGAGRDLGAFPVCGMALPQKFYDVLYIFGAFRVFDSHQELSTVWVIKSWAYSYRLCANLTGGPEASGRGRGVQSSNPPIPVVSPLQGMIRGQQTLLSVT